jgi:hypothetical protein
MKYFQIIIGIIGFIPLFFSSSILAFYFKVANKYNHLPTYGNPDPKYTGFYQSYNEFIEISFSLTFIVFFLWVFIVAFYLKKRKTEDSLLPVYFSTITYLVAFFILFSEIFNWYVD